MTKQRLQFDFAPSAVEALKRLATDTGADTMAAVVRDALALYEHCGPALRRDAQVIIREADGSESRLLLARR